MLVERNKGSSAQGPRQSGEGDDPARSPQPDGDPQAAETAEVGKPAPDFTATDAQGNTHTLSSYRGKYVVLEWFNAQCPFVRKYYDSGAMQELQQACGDKGVVWLTICSSAKGKQGYYEGEALTNLIEKEKSNATSYLVDTDGTVGRRYAAKTTPHMFVISPEGLLLYAGAIDNRPSVRPSDIEGAANYVVQALDAAMAGREIETTSTKSYGCSVKY
ncbi:MAG: thioredoxin family protein [Verrucomicrobia bacterium]|nr:thioredoxin family protein [Verrucomicrobiota bacterium]